MIIPLLRDWYHAINPGGLGASPRGSQVDVKQRMILFTLNHYNRRIGVRDASWAPPTFSCPLELLLLEKRVDRADVNIAHFTLRTGDRIAAAEPVMLKITSALLPFFQHFTVNREAES